MMKTSTKFFSFEGAGYATGFLVWFLGVARRRGIAIRALRSGRNREAKSVTHSRRGFSLVETLSTLGVAIVLLALTVPALRGWRSSVARSNAIGQVLAILQETRSIAMSKGRPAYFVVSDHAMRVDGKPAWTSIAIYQQTADPAQPPEQISRWYHLPEGCHFVNPEESSSFLSAPEVALAPHFQLTAGVKAQGAGHIDGTIDASAQAASTLPYVAFGSTGRVTFPERSTHSRLLLSSLPGESPDTISIALFTGRAKCEP